MILLIPYILDVFLDIEKNKPAKSFFQIMSRSIGIAKSPPSCLPNPLQNLIRSLLTRRDNCEAKMLHATL